ncbi:MAG TPA: TonB-dependent receptor [Caulobacteraceae bacterium]|nr:TonB-dependent receptor [Caulobacteraceae bacterium]
MPPGPLAAALAQFAVQARLSVALQHVEACSPSRGVQGRLLPREALGRLLAGTRCAYRFVGPDAVVVSAAPRPGPPPARERTVAAAAPAEVPLPEIVVTAGRRPVALSRAAFSATVVTGADLTAIGAHDVADLVPLVAGLGMTDLGPGRDKLFLRGLSDGPLTGETQSTVGLYLDGARITYNAPDPDLKLVDIDRVEVLRGPQGALYGAGSIAGIVLLTTNRPDLDHWSAEADASGTATQGSAPGWSVDGMLNAPVVPGKLAVRLVGYEDRIGGYIDDANLGLTNVNEVGRIGLRGAATWRISANWSATASVAYQTLNSADTHYAQPSIGPLSRDLFLQEPHDNDFLAVTLNVNGHLPWADLAMTSSFVRHQFDSRYDASLALPQFVPGSAPARSPFDEANGARLLVNEFTLTSTANGRVEWLAGLFQSISDDDLSQTLTAPLGPSGAMATAYRQQRADTIDELALFGQVTYAFDRNWSLSLGGRAFRVWTDTHAATAQPLAMLSGSFAGATGSSGIAPQAVLRFTPSRDLTLYAQASEGYRSGGFNTAGLVGQVFSADPTGPEPQRRYSGDELWNFETGAKADTAGGLAQIRAAAFYMVWNRVQSNQLLPDGLPYTANLGDGRDFGAELEADVRPAEHWRLQANAIVSEPDLTHPSPAFASAPDNGLPGAATFSGATSAQYERSLGGSLVLRLEASLAYVGASRLTLDATTSARMGDYATGRASAQLIDRDWTLSLFLRAPLTGLGDTFAYGNPFSFRDFPQTTPQRPTSVTLEVRRDFP